MSPKVESKQSEVFAANLVAWLAAASLSFMLGMTISGTALWLALAAEYFAVAQLSAMSSIADYHSIQAHTENWKYRLTERFALEESLDSLRQDEIPNYGSFWDNALEKVQREQSIQKWARFWDNFLSNSNYYVKCGAKATFMILFHSVNTILPALVSHFWI